MKPHHCKWFVAVCVGIGLVRSGTAQAQQPSFTGPPATPRPFTQDIYAGVGRGICTVDNFTGIVAGLVIQGTGKDDKGNTLEFECDVRVMQGIFIGRDTITYRGTFCHTWLDLYTGSGPTRQQIHDIAFNSLSPPFAKEGDANFGPFWTGFVPETSVTGNPYTGKMTLDFADAPQQETFVVFGPTSVPAKASVRVEWLPGFQGLYPYVDPVPTYTVRNPTAGFAGEYTLSGASISFSFTSQVSATDKTPFTFTTNPQGQRVVFAQMGHERTGVFAR